MVFVTRLLEKYVDELVIPLGSSGRMQVERENEGCKVGEESLSKSSKHSHPKVYIRSPSKN